MDPAEQQQPTPVPQSVGPRNYSYQNTPKRTQIPQQVKTSQPPTNVASKQLVTTPQLINKTTTAPQNAIKDLQAQTTKITSQLQPLSEPPVKDPENQVIGKKNDKIDTNISVIKDENDSHHMNEEDGSDDSHRKKGRPILKNIFANRKKSSVRAKEKKIRQNRQLRKVILPKNALMALNEVRGINIGDFVINSNVGGGFTAVVNVNDMQYEGKGPSKVNAKNNACEKALRDYVLAKMRQKPRRSHPPTAELVMDTTEAEGENGIESDGGDSHKPILDDTDDVPMINLTSFALYKLFSDWENDGYEVPEFHPSCPTSQVNTTDSDAGMVIVKEPKKPIIRNNLPENWQTMHPATLLCIMRPGLTYSDYSDKPHAVQNLGITVDGREFIGRGRSKKIARRNTAAEACNALFGTNFEIQEEVKTELIPVDS